MSAFKAVMGDKLFADYIPPFQRHSTTSRDAAQSIVKYSGHARQLVLAYVMAHPQGVTDEQIITETGLRESTARARRVELMDKELVKDSGRTALTRSGRKATLWVAA